MENVKKMSKTQIDDLVVESEKGARVVAILLFSAVTQGFFIVRNKFYETIIMFIVASMMFLPGYFINIITPPYKISDIRNIEHLLMDTDIGTLIKVNATDSNNPLGNQKDIVFKMRVMEGATGKERLASYGLTLSEAGRVLMVSDVKFNSIAEKDGFNIDYILTSVEIPVKQFHQNWVVLMGGILLVIVIFLQRKRNVSLSYI